MITILARIGTDVSRIADAVEHIDRHLAMSPALDEQLKALAGFASITLALLALFTNRRTDRLAEQKSNGLKKFIDGGWRFAIADIALAITTTAALATMLPAFLDSFDLAGWFDRDHTLKSMFSL